MEGGYYLLVIASFFDPHSKTLSFVKALVENAAIATVRKELY